MRHYQPLVPHTQRVIANEQAADGSLRQIFFQPADAGAAYFSVSIQQQEAFRYARDLLTLS